VSENQTAYQRRAYQRAALHFVLANRCCGLLWARQKGKSTQLSETSLFVMLKGLASTVTYASASLLLGREIIIKESLVLQRAYQRMLAAAAEQKLRMETADQKTHKVVDLKPDDFTELFEAQRLEFRLYVDRTNYRRTVVIAPNPATARGWTGWVLLDEVGFIAGFQELMDGVVYIINANADFHLVMATTIPRDDTHYSFELLGEPLGAQFEPNAEGNIYESAGGIPVHRVDIFDGAAAGVKSYDLKTGEPITPMESLARSTDKDSWWRNEGLKWIRGGTAAVDALALDAAQRRGVGSCALFLIDGEDDFHQALAWLAEHLGTGIVGLGVDVATTTNQVSNPTSVTVGELAGVEVIERAVFVWKTKDPVLARGRMRAILETVRHRPEGGRARRLCIDATNEQYFAEETRQQFAALAPVECVDARTSVTLPDGKKVNMKTRLGDLYAGKINDNRVTAPPEQYFRDDHRMVKTEQGEFVCLPGPDGKHGDTFDSGKLMLRALTSTQGALQGVEGIRYGGNTGRGMWKPRRWRLHTANGGKK